MSESDPDIEPVNSISEEEYDENTPQYIFIDVRNEAKRAVQEILKVDEKRATSFERTLYNYSLRKAKAEGIVANLVSHVFRKFYTELVYNQLGLCKKVGNYKKIQKEMKKDIAGWDSKAYISQKLNLEATHNLIENPINIEEGSLQCGKCKGWKTFKYQMQTRSADEGITTFVRCGTCPNRWKM